METSRFIDHLSRTDAMFSDGPDSDAQNHDRSYGSIPENLHLSSLYCSHSSDHLPYRSFITTSVRPFSARP